MKKTSWVLYAGSLVTTSIAQEGGDSGSPNMIPTTDGSLVFIDGSSTRGALSEQMRKDMDFLCTNDTYKLYLNITNYQLNWHTNYP